MGKWKKDKKPKKSAASILSKMRLEPDTWKKMTYYGHAILVCLVPTWLYSKARLDDTSEFFFCYVVSTLLAVVGVAHAYKAAVPLYRQRIYQRREGVVEMQVQKELANQKKMTTEQVYEKLLSRCNDVVDAEATAFVIFYTNISFLASVVTLGPYTFKYLSPATNYAVTMVLSSIIAFVHSSHV